MLQNFKKINPFKRIDDIRSTRVRNIHKYVKTFTAESKRQTKQISKLLNGFLRDITDKKYSTSYKYLSRYKSKKTKRFHKFLTLFYETELNMLQTVGIDSLDFPADTLLQLASHDLFKNLTYSTKLNGRKYKPKNLDDSFQYLYCKYLKMYSLLLDYLDGDLGVSPSDVKKIPDDIDESHTGDNNVNSRGGKIKYLCIHYTAGRTSKEGSAVGVANFFANNEGKGSADYIVDDGAMVQYNPDPVHKFCNAVGGDKYKTVNGARMKGKIKNSNSISIEMCSTFTEGKGGSLNDVNHDGWSFTPECIAMSAKLSTILMKKHNIDIDHVYRHYDVTGKPCPGVPGWNEEPDKTGNISDNKWRAFKRLISKCL